MATNMSLLARDIKRTLIIKFVLLFFLWFFCVKNTTKATSNSVDWMLGPTHSSTVGQHIKNTNDVL